jgi:hypothetical protein
MTTNTPDLVFYAKRGDVPRDGYAQHSPPDPGDAEPSPAGWYFVLEGEPIGPYATEALARAAADEEWTEEFDKTDELDDTERYEEREPEVDTQTGFTKED